MIIGRVRFPATSRANEFEAHVVDPTLLMASLFFGTLGTAYFVFGKKSGRVVPIGSGITLMVLPMMLPGVAALLVVSSLVAAVPFIVRE